MDTEDIDKKVEKLLEAIKKQRILKLNEKQSRLFISRKDEVNIYAEDINNSTNFLSRAIKFDKDTGEKLYITLAIQQILIDNGLIEKRLEIDGDTVEDLRVREPVKNQISQHPAKEQRSKPTTPPIYNKHPIDYFGLTKDLLKKLEVQLQLHTFDSVGIDDNNHLFAKLIVIMPDGTTRKARITSTSFIKKSVQDDVLAFLNKEIFELEKGLIATGRKITEKDLETLADKKQTSAPIEYTALNLGNKITQDISSFLTNHSELLPKTIDPNTIDSYFSTPTEALKQNLPKVTVNIDFSGTKKVLIIKTELTDKPIGRYLLSNSFNIDDAKLLATEKLEQLGFNIEDTKGLRHYKAFNRQPTLPIKRILNREVDGNTPEGQAPGI